MENHHLSVECLCWEIYVDSMRLQNYISQQEVCIKYDNVNYNPFITVNYFEHSENI